jgi:hypothetical protein
MVATVWFFHERIGGRRYDRGQRRRGDLADTPSEWLSAMISRNA